MVFSNCNLKRKQLVIKNLGLDLDPQYSVKIKYLSDFANVRRLSNVSVRPSLEPGWLEGHLDGKVGLVPENYVEYI
jgi:hypothetical protein